MLSRPGPEKGWNDIAYNFLIDSEGGIWEGRAGSLGGPVAGDATGGNQGFSQLVCLIGDFNAANPSSASKTSLALLLAWLADRYGVPTTAGATVSFVSRGSNKWPAGVDVTTPTITGHRTMSSTTCPGSNLYSYVTGGLVADVNAARGGVPATTVATSVATTAPATTSPPVTASAATAPPATTPAPVEPGPALTTVPPDPIPSTSTSTTSPVASTTARLPPPTSAPVTIVPEVLAAETVARPGSSLLWGGAALAAAATGLLAWRIRRMDK